MTPNWRWNSLAETPCREWPEQEHGVEPLVHVQRCAGPFHHRAYTWVDVMSAPLADIVALSSDSVELRRAFALGTIGPNEVRTRIIFGSSISSHHEMMQTGIIIRELFSELIE